jgi:hypothetical protein
MALIFHFYQRLVGRNSSIFYNFLIEKCIKYHVNDMMLDLTLRNFVDKNRPINVVQNDLIWETQKYV